jgi:hypothetical protein
MKKLLILLSFATITASCSDDDTVAPQEEPFFNLEVGNKWVYKRYNQNGPNEEYVFSGVTDTVKVTGQHVIEGENYYVLHHTGAAIGALDEQNNEYVRVNENGHLVKPNGIVKHPGGDTNYHYTDYPGAPATPFGIVEYQLLPLQEISVEGSNYLVYSYSGYFTPIENSGPQGIGHVVNYQPGLGIVSEKSRFVSADWYFENRLVSYELN